MGSVMWEEVPRHMNVDIAIEVVDSGSPHLIRIKELGRANSSTLGFFPEGAFDDYAAKKQILTAVEANSNQCVGYLLYRVSAQQATVVHLCIDPAWRRHGIARKLTNSLFEHTRNLYGVGLKCRRDYEASSVWPRLGFVALAEVQGRSADGTLLTYWWRDHGHPTLFSHLFAQAAQDRVPVVIDQNVLCDIHQVSSDASEESRCLLADWMADEIEICVTKEALNEIERIDNDAQRSLLRNTLGQYTTVNASPHDFEQAINKLRPLFPTKLSVSDESDRRHLAWAVAANAKYFVTRDDYLCKIADDVYDCFQTLIYRPSQLIVHFDELLHTASYQPARLAGTPLTRQRIQEHEVPDLQRAFAGSGERETPASFRDRARRFLADPQKYDCTAIKSPDGAFLAFLAMSRPSEYVYQIDAFRIIDKDPISATLARYLAFSAIAEAARHGCDYVYIVDDSLPQLVQHVLAQEGFQQGSSGWLKVTLRSAVKEPALSDFLSAYVQRVPSEYGMLRGIPSILKQVDPVRAASLILDIEHLFWPLKVIDAAVPSFIIPIRPVWAQHLFDETLADLNLFGAKTELALQRECVFYRAKNPAGGLTAPSRVLWYVSKDSRYPGAGAIRACSYIDEVVIGQPKDLFKRFQRYGIYEWEDLLRTVHGDVGKEMMALRFRDTELLSSPVPWGKDLIAAIGRTAHLQSPIRISDEAFAAIYLRAMGKPGSAGNA